ncbi:hypothetical protein HPB50_024668 [Hyalomma asiaticum]|uniref:Uncharacterized protein n=1 Tax=Hyalomma asiaticum TaxID=266040 RepID=A0ACB7T1H4_HYAAI|nr:hypothetical protein HPB50_024668 [Hyalomma asiaticum]
MWARLERRLSGSSGSTAVLVGDPGDRIPDQALGDPVTRIPECLVTRGSGICSAEEEDVEHLVLHCTGLSPRPAEGTDLSPALGFTDSASSATNGMVDAASTSKHRLRKWWLETWR